MHTQQSTSKLKLGHSISVGPGRTVIPSWPNTTGAPRLRYGTVYYQGLAWSLCARVRVLALQLGISKFKCRLMSYLMWQVSPEANLCVSASSLLLMIIRTATTAAALSSRIARIQQTAHVWHSTSGCRIVYCHCCWSHYRCGSLESCAPLEYSTAPRTWVLVPP